MFNFTGAARRPRQVNLSGRKSTTTGLAAVAAREERAAREAERKRLGAAKTIQRFWRGRNTSAKIRDVWRQEWDEATTIGNKDTLQLMGMFLGFMGYGKKMEYVRWTEEDVTRLHKMVDFARSWIENDPGQDQKSEFLRVRFAKLLFDVISKGAVTNGECMRSSLRFLSMLAAQHPKIVNDDYYAAMSAATLRSDPNSGFFGELVNAVSTPLEMVTGPYLESIYNAFALRYLTTPNLISHLGDKGVCELLRSVDIYQVAVSNTAGLDADSTLWLLAHSIFISSHDSKFSAANSNSSLSGGIRNYITFIGSLLGSVTTEVSQRIGLDDITMTDDAASDSGSDSEAENKRSRMRKKGPLPAFVKTQIESLVQQPSISSLMSHIKSTDDNAKTVAGFALILLLVFPARRTDMRFWLCVAKTSDGVPAVKYIWNSVKNCQLVNMIGKEAKTTIDVLKYPPALQAVKQFASFENIQDQWNLIFLFLEMYSFVLVTGDDHEFLQGKGRQLPLEEVKNLSVFLKNLAFAMYWWYEDIIHDTNGTVERSDSGRPWELKYFRTVVTDVLKAIYTRDSRRHFLPKDHWLMEKYLSLDGFISAVVEEEEKRQNQAANGEDSDPEPEEDPEFERIALLLHDSRDRRALNAAKRLKKRTEPGLAYLITPRLEILQNLPFMIPFDKRVEIFREFVQKDQTKRRNGYADPDQWRFAVASAGPPESRERLRRQHAVVRRDNMFEDAFEAYYSLGDKLKEPIQITFVDKFGAEEAGIDGGGVTKEFLTGVCGKAFSPSADYSDDNDVEAVAAGPSGYSARDMFHENAERLLYPNPTILEEIKYRARSWKIDVRTELSSILSRYEFAGRILGKCLYEGILVELLFAPFFLLKWSQPNSTSAVGVNDLRDLDAETYRHLMALMDFDGDVESTFNLDFTITTKVAPNKVETRELKPGGSKIPVTNNNRLEYVHLFSKYRLVQEPALQTRAFLQGLTTIINPAWLKMFNQSELQTLVGGDTVNPVDVEDLRRYTIYGGLYEIGTDREEHPTIKLFWEVMRELDDEQRGNVLRFVTSVSRAPLLGFRVLRPKFCIRDAGDDQTRLCSASTCVNLLKLPRYATKKVLKEKLLYSINSKAGFDLS
ncbi:hypothetical protein BZA77DRAFT_256651 [Pyronema omphalodes]|nr:hypothetical protein BZA77DRAFT_256651 [Pyronema omphalodes]